MISTPKCKYKIMLQ